MSGTALTASSLAAALSPKGGLQPISLASKTYALASTAASAQRLLNFYAEQLPSGSRSPFILKSTPGTELIATAGSGPLWASETLGGSYWAISGDHAYVLQDIVGASPSDLGFVGVVPDVDFHAPTIAVGNTAVVFCVPPNVYVSDLAGAPVVQVTAGSGNLPAEGASSVCYIDGYYVFTSFSGSFFFQSNLLDASHFDSLQFTQLSSFTDYCEFCFTHNGELWLFGQNAIQPWYDSGNPDQPFVPHQGAVIARGIGSARTAVQLDGSMFYLGIDKIIYRTVGYNAQRISDHPLEELLADYDGGYLRGISACGYMHEGHACYAISLPLAGAGRTFVYDCATQLWHERSSSTDGTGRWHVNTAALLGARQIMGDAVNGNLYHMKTAFADENGVTVPRIAVLPLLTEHGPRTFMNRLEIEMEVGTTSSPGSITVDWSDDGGITFKASRALSTGDDGATRTRVATTRLGSFRQRALRIQAVGRATIYSADADISPRTAASA